MGYLFEAFFSVFGDVLINNYLKAMSLNNSDNNSDTKKQKVLKTLILCFSACLFILFFVGLFFFIEVLNFKVIGIVLMSVTASIIIIQITIGIILNLYLKKRNKTK